MIYSAKDEQKLMTEIWDPHISENLYNFVMFAFPWGKAGTPLANFKGPRNWQRDEMEAISNHIRNNKERMGMGLDPEVYRSATASGRGIGKSALVSWLAYWNLSCQLGSTTIITANNEAQLKTVTWGEIGKWHTMAINSHWFDKAALSITPQKWIAEAAKKKMQIDDTKWNIVAKLWSEENPDAFAGQHSMISMMMIMDEASGIPAPIWGVADGYFTEKILHRYFLVYSNPRRNTGAFFECFNKHREFWKTRNIDSRSIDDIDKQVLENIIAKHGPESYDAYVEVYGKFPGQGEKQFISRDVINDAVERPHIDETWAPIIMGVDVARFGGDSTVIRFRQGRDARSIPAVKLKSMDNMAVANECARLINKINPDAVCVDAGNGTGVIDRLREMGFKVHEVWFGSKADDKEWANKRTELWARMRDWLKGSCIDNDQDLKDDLAGPEYKFQGSSDKIMLETKEQMKARGLHSPDNGDALAVTFAVRVASKSLNASRKNNSNRRTAKDVDYRIF